MANLVWANIYISGYVMHNSEGIVRPTRELQMFLYVLFLSDNSIQQNFEDYNSTTTEFFEETWPHTILR